MTNWFKSHIPLYPQAYKVATQQKYEPLIFKTEIRTTHGDALAVFHERINSRKSLCGFQKGFADQHPLLRVIPGLSGNKRKYYISFTLKSFHATHNLTLPIK